MLLVTDTVHLKRFCKDTVALFISDQLQLLQRVGLQKVSDKICRKWNNRMTWEDHIDIFR